MKLILSIVTSGIMLASMSSCTTYVEQDHGRVGLGGYRTTNREYVATDHNYRTSGRDHHVADSHSRVSSRAVVHHDSVRHNDSHVKARVRAPLGISTGVDVR